MFCFWKMYLYPHLVDISLVLKAVEKLWLGLRYPCQVMSFNYFCSWYANANIRTDCVYNGSELWKSMMIKVLSVTSRHIFSKLKIWQLGGYVGVETKVKPFCGNSAISRATDWRIRIGVDGRIQWSLGYQVFVFSIYSILDLCADDGRRRGVSVEWCH